MTQYVIPVFKCRLVRDGNIKMVERELAYEHNSAAVFMNTLADLPHEEMHAVYLNSRLKIIGFQVLSVGGRSGTALMTADVFRGALSVNAASLILAHNHPSGDPTPSNDDIEFTQVVKKAGQILNISLLDHIVCAPSTNTWRSII